VYYMSADGRKGMVAAEKATVVDTTAAGDTFVGRYALDAVGMMKGEGFDIEAAVRRANRAAAKTVEKAGAQDSIPWRDELE
jgi:ribokinase